MKKITVEVEFILSDSAPIQLPFSDIQFGDLIVEVLKDETNPEDISEIKASVNSYEGIEFKID